MGDGLMAIRKVQFRSLIGIPDGFAGLDVSGRVTAPHRDVLSAKDFGAMGDGASDDTAKVLAAINMAIATGRRLHFPSGTYVVSPASLDISIGSGQRLSMSGDGAGTIIKLPAEMPGTTDASRRLFRFNLSGVVDVLEVSGMVLDGNARGSAAPNPYSQFQQSHLCDVIVAAGATLKLARFYDLVMKDPNADGIKNGSSATSTVQSFVIDNVQEIDRTMFRSSIQMSRVPVCLTISGFTGDSIEVEEDVAVGYDRTVKLSNCHVDELDILLRTDTAIGRVIMSNVTTVTEFGLHGCDVQASNCRLRLRPSDGRSFNNARYVDMDNCTVLHPWDGGTNTFKALDFRPTAAHDQVATFNNCKFLIDVAGPITPAAGQRLIYGQHNVAVSDLKLREYRFNNCRFDPRTTDTYYAYRNGSHYLNDCEYGGTGNVFTWFSSADNRVELVVDGGDFRKCTGAFMSAAWSSVFDQTTAIRQLVLLGQHVGAAAAVIASTAGQPTGVSGITNARRVVAASLPAAAIQGDRYSVNQPAAGAVCEYVATTGSTTSATWKAAATLAG